MILVIVPLHTVYRGFARYLLGVYGYLVSCNGPRVRPAVSDTPSFSPSSNSNQSSQRLRYLVFTTHTPYAVVREERIRIVGLSDFFEPNTDSIATPEVLLRFCNRTKFALNILLAGPTITID